MSDLVELLSSDLDPSGPERRIAVQYGEHQPRIPYVVGEFWTSRQRQASSLHEVSYRACFKPQLPRYFINRFCPEQGVVYDPFSGRGTTALEAALLGRRVIANDINPLSSILLAPRLNPPTLGEVEARLQEIPLDSAAPSDLDLSMFYHAETENEIRSLREYLRHRRNNGIEDSVDAWIRMVATNRLTGHSPGFFSVYSFPPNQAVSSESQRRINALRNQIPPYRDTKALILKKSRQLLAKISESELATLRASTESSMLLSNDASDTPYIASQSVDLVVTSPPFLDVVQYADDNWLRCWFNDLDADALAQRITVVRSAAEWQRSMERVFLELARVLRPGGMIAFEVGEVRGGTVRLEELVAPVARAAGLDVAAIVINAQQFTKTAHIWGVANNAKGTNTNRIVLLRHRTHG